MSAGAEAEVYEYDPDADWVFEARVNRDELLPLAESAAELVSEFILHIDTEDCWVNVVDPANVGWLNYTEDAVEKADGEIAVGVVSADLVDALDELEGWGGVRLSIMPEDSEIRLMDDSHTTVIGALNPASMRKEPDADGWEAEQTVQVDAWRFIGVTAGMAAVSDGPVAIAPRDGELVFLTLTGERRQFDGFDKEWRIDADAQDGPVSLYTNYYLNIIAKTLPGDGRVDIEIGDQVPMRVDNGDGYAFTLAPRFVDEMPPLSELREGSK